MKKKSKSTKKYPVGTKLEYLTIQSYVQDKIPYIVRCSCVCGNIKDLYLSNIIPKPNARYTHSCGCMRSQIVTQKNSTHGLSNTKFYKHWRSMFDRTESEKYINRESYKGVRVSKRWKLFNNFRNDMYESWLEHEKLHGQRNTTLDRINVYGNYSKKNCKWSTQAEQGLNKKNTLKVFYDGEDIALKTLCTSLGKNYNRTYSRIRRGFPIERALNSKPWQR